MRKSLDALYHGSGVLAGVFLVAIGIVVMLQVGANAVDAAIRMLTGEARGLLIPSYTDFTGFFLAASSFLALAYTLRSGGHIRVAMALHRATPRVRRAIEIWCAGCGLLLTGYATWFALLLVLESYQFGDMSTGMISVPLWIPQLAMLAGLAVLTVAFLDQFVTVARGGLPAYLEDERETERLAAAGGNAALEESVKQL
jgi:TRAP-type C4-dicarboxylate transport system permease small subunit